MPKHLSQFRRLWRPKKKGRNQGAIESPTPGAKKTFTWKGMKGCFITRPLEGGVLKNVIYIFDSPKTQETENGQKSSDSCKIKTSGITYLKM